jgi:hypothetical protein
VTSETHRLNKLKDTSLNLCKRYMLPEAAVKIIERAGKIHGQQSRAIQVAVELLWDKVGWAVPDTAMSVILDSPLTSKTYKLTPRTVTLINTLAPEYGTRGKLLAACAFMLSRPDPRTALSPAISPLPHKKIYARGEIAETLRAQDEKELRARKAKRRKR